MKILMTIIISLFSLGVFAQGDLNSLKEKATTNIDRNISSLQLSRSCINDAATVEAFKACKYDMAQDMNAQKQEFKVREKIKVKSTEESN